MEHEVVTPDAGAGTAAPEPRPTAPPIRSRFLFVDVAALRAKQLRRGAVPRLDRPAEPREGPPRKPERVAMDEVRHGLVLYDVHAPTPEQEPAAAPTEP